MAGDWTISEVEATIADYFDMLECELRGIGYNKSEHRRRLAGVLNQRPDGAIERKHQNISAILIELGFVYISGYKPLRNYQQLLFEAVADRLGVNHGLAALVEKQVVEPAIIPSIDEILSALVEAPSPDLEGRRDRAGCVRERPSIRTGVDYLATEARNRP